MKNLIKRTEDVLSLEKTYNLNTGCLRRKIYEKEMSFLHIELCKLQQWVINNKKKIILIFEGRDAAGKGGTIKALNEHLNPRSSRVVALTKPTKRELSEWYFKRYILTLPSGGEIVFYDRSWYNRAGVEKVMNFCTQSQYREFISQVSNLEHMFVQNDTMIFKYFLDVSKEEQKYRITRRKKDPIRMWKLSPIDDISMKLWNEYSKAYEEMFSNTHTHFSPWTIVNADDKKRARINIARDILNKIEYDGKEHCEVCLLPDPSVLCQYSEYKEHRDLRKDVIKAAKNKSKNNVKGDKKSD